MRNKYFQFQYLLSFFILFTGGGLQAQISGTVTDGEGEPLIGATVRIEDTSYGAITDMDGAYSIADAPAEGTITASYTGYNKISEEIEGRSTINFTLTTDESSLEEIVVVGYGVQNKEEITGSIASVKPEDFNKGNVNNASELIQGKVAGVSISSPGGDPNSTPTIRLRGISTFGGATSPLILVDGVTVNSLDEVDPNDIQSIDILKDASSSAIYGARGSNGVILVTTKSGNFNQETKISYNGQTSVEDIAKQVDVASAEEYLSLPNASDQGASIDYFDNVSQTGISQVHNLAVDGGSGSTTYRLSGTLRDIEGTLLKSGFEQLNIRGKVQHEAVEGKLRLTGDAMISRANRDLSFTEAYRYAATTNPTVRIYEEDSEDGYFEFNAFDYFNPVALVEQNTNEQDNNNYKGSIQLDYDLLDNLTASASYALNMNTGQNYEYYKKEAKFRGQGRDGLINRETFNTERQTVNITLNYNKPNITDAIDFDGLVGYTYEQTDNDGFETNNGDFISNDPGFNQLGGGTDVQYGLATLASYFNRQQLRGYFGRLNFNIADYYNFNTNLRYEGSNAFGPNEQFGLFYGIGGSADLSSIFEIESFDYLKLRASFGSTGNLPGGAFLYQGPYVQSGFAADGFGDFFPLLNLERDPNPNLKWEEKQELNLGVDFETKNRLFNGSLDFFDTESKDLILFLTGDTERFPLTGNGYANIGSIGTSGLELLLSYNGIDNDNFTWIPTLTSTVYLSNKLTDLDRPFERIANAGSPGNNNTPMVLLEEGGNFGQIWGATYTGVDANGEPVYVDTNGDGDYVPADDNTVIGSGVPDVEIGFNNQFNYGQWDAQVFFRGAFGHDLVNMYRFFYENFAPSSYNRVVTDKVDENLTAAPQQTISSHFVENADFVKIDNVTIGYTLPLKSNFVDGLRFFANGQGIATFTGYTGVDPEIRWIDSGPSDNGSFAESDNRAPGIDRRNTYIRPVTVTLGASFNIK